MEDRTVPAYVPALGWGESEGYPLQQPGVIGLAFAYGDVNIEGYFYESVLAADTSGSTLSGSDATHIGHVFNTEGPVITLAGGALALGDNIEFGRASGYTSSPNNITLGNEVLVNSGPTGGGSLTALKGESLKYLDTIVESGSQVVLGDSLAASNTTNLFTKKFVVAGEGIGSAGAIQAQAGIDIIQGAVVSSGSGSIVVSAAAGSTLIINGDVDGLRSATAFSRFVIKGQGTVILDNVAPVATITPKAGAFSGTNNLTFVVDLSEPVRADLVNETLQVTNGTVTGISKISSTKYEFTVAGNVPDGGYGNIEASIAPGVLTDFAYLSNAGSNVAKITVDRERPTASGTFSDLDKQHISKSTIPIQVIFTDGAGAGIDPGTIAATNLLVTTDNGRTLTVSPNPIFNATTGKVTYVVESGSTWGDLGASGPVRVTVALVDGSVKDHVGNANLGTTLGGFTVDITKEPTQVPPTITSANSTTFEVGKPGAFTFSATGKPAPTFAIVDGSLPSGVTLDPVSGDLTGTPAAVTGGVYQLTVQASNGIDPYDSQIFTLTVNEAAIFTSNFKTTFEVGKGGTFQFTANGYPSPLFSISSGTLPVGLTLSNGGSLSGKPTVGQGGIYTFTVTASNGVGALANQDFSLTINEAPSITSGDKSTFEVGKSGTFQIVSRGFPLPVFSIAQGKLPDGLGLDPVTGVISGVPTVGTGGLSSITLIASNGVGTNSTQVMAVGVKEALTTKTVIVTNGPTTYGQEIILTARVTLDAGNADLSGGVVSFGAGLTGLGDAILAKVNGVYEASLNLGSLKNAGSYSFVATYQGDSFASGLVTVGVSASNPVQHVIDKANLKISSQDKTKIYGAVLPALTAEYVGLVNGENPSVVRGTILATTGKKSSGVGTYPITVTGSVSGNYAITEVNGTLTVSPAPISVTAENKARMVGEVNPPLTFTASSLVNGDTIGTAFTGALSTTAVTSSPSGVYPISRGTLASANYDITFVGATLSVNQLPAFTSSSAATFEVGKAGSFEVIASGFPAPVILLDQGALPNGLIFEEKTYKITGTPASGSGGIYSLVFQADNVLGTVARQNFTLTVGQGPVITSPNNAIFDLGKFLSFTVKSTGFPNPTYRVSSGQIPAGLTFNGTTGVISGTPASTAPVNYSFTLAASNGFGTDATQNFTLSLIKPKNDPPSGSDKIISIFEDAKYTFQRSDFGFADSDSPANNFLSVKITTLPLSGKLSLLGALTPLVAGQFVSVADIAAQKLSYTPATNANGPGLGKFTFQVKDDGGVPNGGVDLDPTPNSIAFDVKAVNDAPTGAVKTTTILEDETYVFQTTDFGFSDGIDNPPNHLKAVAISSLPLAGKLVLFGATGAITVGQRIQIDDISGGKLAYIPGPNGGGVGYSKFTFRVQDDGGVANGGMELDQTARTFTFNVTPVNDAPTGADKSVSMLEDGTYSINVSDFGFSDALDVPANGFASVTITAVPDKGVLQLVGQALPVAVGQSIPVAALVAGKLVFKPNANENGKGYGQLAFQVRDNGGQANGGVDLDPSPQVLTIDVNPVNDAPKGTSGTVSLSEDEVYALKVSDFGFADPIDNPPGAFQSLIVVALPQKGTLSLVGGSPIVIGQSVLVSDISLGKLVYKPAANGNGFGYAQFAFRVRDNGGLANGGIDTDPVARVITFDVAPVNDPPTLAVPASFTVLEDVAGNLLFIGTPFRDPDSQSLTVRLSVNAGSIFAATFAGINVGGTTEERVISGTMAVLNSYFTTPGKITYLAPANQAGQQLSNTKLTTVVSDGSLTAAATSSIQVTPVNDPPSGADKVFTISEDGSYFFKPSDFGFSDAKDSPANGLMSVKIATLPQVGKLSLSGLGPIVAGQYILAGELPRLVFTPGPNGNGPDYAKFKFQVRDNGGVANGGIDLDPLGDTITFDVTPVNDPPTLAIPPGFSFLEDVAGNLVFTGTPFGDVDSNILTVTLSVQSGTLSATSTPLVTADGAGTSWTFTGSLKDLNSYFTTPGNITYVGAANMVGPVSIVTTVSDGSLASTANSTIQIASVNDAPSGADSAFTTLEDSVYTFRPANFGYQDPNDSPANDLLAVRINTLPLKGKLSLQGSLAPVLAGQFILASDLPRLVFTPAANGNGPNYASFQFQVKDTGGVANGGIDFDPTPHTITFHVTPVNDAPSGTSSTVIMGRSTSYVLGVANFGFTDSKDAPANNFGRVQIVTIPATGKGFLYLNGVKVVAGAFVLADDIKNGKLKYTPPVGATGYPYSSFTFKVEDDGGTANGGTNLDPVAKTLNFRIV